RADRRHRADLEAREVLGHLLLGRQPQVAAGPEQLAQLAEVEPVRGRDDREHPPLARAQYHRLRHALRRHVLGRRLGERRVDRLVLVDAERDPGALERLGHRLELRRGRRDVRHCPLPLSRRRRRVMWAQYPRARALTRFAGRRSGPRGGVDVRGHYTLLSVFILVLELLDLAAPMNIVGILVFDPREGRPPPAVEEVRALPAERIGALPRFTKRLSATHVGGLEWPSWEPDPAFDLTHHTRRLAVPSPGGRAELFELAGLFWSRRIDRTRPLWELALLEGLADGRWGLALKLHHCLADRIGSVEVGPLLLELDREGRAAPIPPPAPRSAGPPGGLRAGLVRAARTALGTLRHPRRAGRLLDRTRALAELIVRDELMAAPRTSLNVPIGADRRFAGVE